MEMQHVLFSIHVDVKAFNNTYTSLPILTVLYSVILSVLDPRKWEYLKDYSLVNNYHKTNKLLSLQDARCNNKDNYSLDFEDAYMNTYLASWEACRY